MLNKIKWIFIIAGISLFAYAVYSSEQVRLSELEEIGAITPKYHSDTLASYTRDESKEFIPGVIKQTTRNERIYISEITGDTLDLSKGKFIMILADKFRDKNISYSFSMFNSDSKTCAWSSGVLKISVYDKKFKLLKSATVEIDRELEGTCTQFEELNLYMGDLLERAVFVNAEFADSNGERYYQKRMRLGGIVDLKPSTDNLTNEERIALKKVKQETEILFKELLNFKGNRDFHVYGFAPGYKYYNWLDRVKTLRNNPSSQLLLITDHFSVGDLLNLGLEYVGSNGTETEYSRLTKQKIQSGLQE